MSRIGNKPIPVPEGVKVAVADRTVSVEGPLGRLEWTHRPEVSVQVDGRRVVVERARDDRVCRSLHGLTRSLVANMVEGCHQGFVKALEVFGVGYSVQLQGSKLTLSCGLSHPVVFEVPPEMTVEVQTAQARGDTEPARLTVRGPDKQAVGELAARIRRVRPPEPYKGKGVRYAGEHIKRKQGKAFAGTGA
jgi:large subunit ribosomal protein L6